ncbi:MAG: hypothetical protein JO050_09405 [Acidimicrobiia bacterium]|nr:hypothetical protein [Acidimicrobiia bacterium]
MVVGGVGLGAGAFAADGLAGAVLAGVVVAGVFAGACLTPAGRAGVAVGDVVRVVGVVCAGIGAGGAVPSGER